MRIAHISDLHINSAWFDPIWAENLLRLLERFRPEIVIATGDLTDEGYWSEYQEVACYFKRIEVATKIVVPGNHDARNEGDLIFEELFGTRTPRFENSELVILGVDSTQPDLEEGHVGRETYPLIRETFCGREGKLKILALHHHIVPVPGTGRERDIPVDAGDLMQLIDELGIHLVLSGHKHKAWLWKVNGTYYITAGTATTHRLKGKDRPSFNLLEVVEEGVRLVRVNVADGSHLEGRLLQSFAENLANS